MLINLIINRDIDGNIELKLCFFVLQNWKLLRTFYNIDIVRALYVKQTVKNITLETGKSDENKK